MKSAISILRQCGIQPTPQRIAVVESVLISTAHPTADEILVFARKKCPTVSRATVYNTLNLLVEKRLIGMQAIREGAVVFDPNIQKHHHFIDEDTGDIYDIPWDQFEVRGRKAFEDFEILDVQVIMRGKRRKK
ncbi:MAG: transcriptional repressor [candidate division Zixibacteria bacterium]|nr:transcriptional repressor [candidate division Zixibacteria bacterium]